VPHKSGKTIPRGGRGTHLVPRPKRGAGGWRTGPRQGGERSGRVLAPLGARSASPAGGGRRPCSRFKKKRTGRISAIFCGIFRDFSGRIRIGSEREGEGEGAGRRRSPETGPAAARGERVLRAIREADKLSLSLYLGVGLAVLRGVFRGARLVSGRP
jgi:hypothetical protein